MQRDCPAPECRRTIRVRPKQWRGSFITPVSLQPMTCPHSQWAVIQSEQFFYRKGILYNEYVITAHKNVRATPLLAMAERMYMLTVDGATD